MKRALNILIAENQRRSQQRPKGCFTMLRDSSNALNVIFFNLFFVDDRIADKTNLTLKLFFWYPVRVYIRLEFNRIKSKNPFKAIFSF